MLWAAAMYLVRQRKFHWVATVPAAFMTVVVATFISNSGIGFNLPMNAATSIGIGAAVVAVVAFFWKARLIRISSPDAPVEP
jgi:carbon starvation protein CstA